ncbi:MAG: YncE family protein, partial [Actinomycetia bacterium]|nr:YncE family protein [Actinomycetes bacterium]
MLITKRRVMGRGARCIDQAAPGGPSTMVDWLSVYTEVGMVLRGSRFYLAAVLVGALLIAGLPAALAAPTVTATIAVGNNPAGVAITPDGSTAYVTNFENSNVSVIDTATNTVTTTIAVGDEPAGVAITPDGSTAYVPNFENNNVSVIDTATNTVGNTIAV